MPVRAHPAPRTSEVKCDSHDQSSAALLPAALARHAGVSPQRALRIRLILALLACGLLVLAACLPSSHPLTQRTPDRQLTLLVTSDVHGWLNPLVPRKTSSYQGGLAELAGAWRALEGYDVALHARLRPRPFLVIDAGDMWTGPPESTLAQGRPMVEAFNALGYDAVAVGNHEFDFTINVLRENARLALFPLLSANIQTLADGPSLDFCRPSMLLNVGGVRVGLIGLSTLETPRTTFPDRVRGLEFLEYDRKVREAAGPLLHAGAEMLVVVAHVPVPELEETAERLTDLPIRVWIGGHSHRKELRVLERRPETASDDVILLNPGAFARAYGKIALTFHGAELAAHAEQFVAVEGDLKSRPYPPDPTLAELARKAALAVDGRMGEQIGVLADPLPQGNVDHSPMGELVADTWLEAFPQAELAITNLGGIRQSLEPGPVTLKDVFSVLPFQNELVMIDLTPAQLREALSVGPMLVAGMQLVVDVQDKKRTVQQVLDPQGRPLQEDKTYKVITTDFLYAGGDGMPFRSMDVEPTWIGVNWRDPVVEAIRHAHGPVKAPAPGRVKRVAQTSTETAP